MKKFELDIKTDSHGCYLSSEQIDLLTIVQVNNWDELYEFINSNAQLFYTPKEISELKELDIETAKRKVFKDYQDTFIPHRTNKKEEHINRLLRLGLSEEEIADIIYILETKENRFEEIKKYIMDKFPDNYMEMIMLNHRFISRERDNIKDVTYEEIDFLNRRLDEFDTILIGSGKLTHVQNRVDGNLSFDFFLPNKDLEFARRNNKKVRYHALLDRNIILDTHKNLPKEELLEILKEYVKQSIDFINANQDVIVAVDLFNELVSFDKTKKVLEDGIVKREYSNIWKDAGFTFDELLECYDYALEQKSENISYLYNEPFLENNERRKKVLKTLRTINLIKPGLIDTLGSQMHITFDVPEDDILDCFDDLEDLEKEDYDIEITEFDLSVSKHRLINLLAFNKNIDGEGIKEYKEEKMFVLGKLISSTGVKLKGITYWTLLDKMDHNMERIMDELIETERLSENKLKRIHSVYSGLYESDILSKLTTDQFYGKK